MRIDLVSGDFAAEALGHGPASGRCRIQALRNFASKHQLAAPGNLELAVRTMAILGGYLYRKKAPPPGHQEIWEGWTRFIIMSEAYELRGYFEPPAIASLDEPGS